jgi:ribosomal protein S12 methylthiotransferase accessory factor
VDRPRLKANFRAVVNSENVFLAAEDRHFLVQGRGAVAILPYLDGRHTIADIAISLRAEVDPSDILRAIRRYGMYDALADGRPTLPEAELAYWDALGGDAARQAGALAAVPVTVLTVGGADAGPLTEALNRVGLPARAAQTDLAAAEVASGELLIVVTDDYLRPELMDINTAMLSTGGRWLLTKPSGLVPWLGPLFEPGVTGCLACLQQRLRGNRQVERYLLGKFGDQALLPEHPPAISSGTAAVAGLLAGELARTFVTDGTPVLHGKMVTIDLRTLQTDEHLLIRRPQCPSCGDPGLMAQRGPKVTIESRPVSHRTAGGLRTESLAVTFDRLSRHISPYLGAVSSLRTHAASDNGIVYTYTAGHNFAMIGDNMGLLRRNIRGQSGGKGKTELQAKVSAVCEAIERYSAVCGGDEPAIRAAFSDLGYDRAIHPAQLLMFSPTQYEQREEWNRDPAHRLHSVPEPFRTDLPVDWTPAWSLTHDRQQLVPAAYAWYGHPDVKDHFYCFADSNGTAAGNCREEAIVQGFCELVERDAVALWWYNQVRRPGVDLDSLRDPYVDAVRELYDGMGRSLWMLDLTSDLGIPAFAGVSHRIGHPAEDILVGFGAHLDPRIAAMRALTEVNQFLPVVERRDAGGNTMYMEDEIGALTWWREAKIAEEPWLCPDDSVPLRKITDYPVSEDDDLASWVARCLRAAASCGTEVVVLDQSRPDLELSVVRVVVPGLRHFWRRLGPGRLYDAPVRMGWLAEPTPEDGFNKWNVFF